MLLALPRCSSPRGGIAIALASSGVQKLGLPAICLETVHVRAAMSAQRNKTDRADAPGHRPSDAHGLVSPGPHQVAELLLDTASADAPAQFEGRVPRPVERLRHSLKAFGIRLSKVGRGAFEKAVRTAVAQDPLSCE